MMRSGCGAGAAMVRSIPVSHPAMTRALLRTLVPALGMAIAAGAPTGAAPTQEPAAAQRPLSPSGHSATQVGGTFDPVQYGYLHGPWIDVYYGQPLKRGRDLFGPPDWADMLNDGAPVWRAGANLTTRLVTEAPLIIGGTRVEPGEYTLFIDLGGRRLDLHRLHLAGAAGLRRRGPGRALRRLRLHRRPRRAADADGTG